MFGLLISIIYLAFISLGIPDSILGSAWPSMYVELGVPISYAGIISVIISVGTITSSLFSGKLTKCLGAGRLTAICIGMTAASLLGFSLSRSFIALCILAIPYGLGAGSVDAALNNYVAIHLSSRHMSWIHCMWGLGTVVGPYVMSFALSQGKGWNGGYFYISIIQIILTLIMSFSLPLWKNQEKEGRGVQTEETVRTENTSILKTLREPGTLSVMITFFCYCAAEQTAMLWASSYLNVYRGVSEEISAASVGIFFIGITLGRFVNGFLTLKFSDTALIRAGQALMVIGGVVLLLPFGMISAIVGLLLFGIGDAPVYPCIMHATPKYYGNERSQTMIGLQTACAHMGVCVMPVLFGIIARYISISLMPVYLLALTVITIIMHEIFLKCVLKINK